MEDLIEEIDTSLVKVIRDLEGEESYYAIVYENQGIIKIKFNEKTVGKIIIENDKIDEALKKAYLLIEGICVDKTKIFK